MSITDIQAAVKRYQENEYASSGNDWDSIHGQTGHALLIADTLTNPAPLTKEALEEMGFKEEPCHPGSHYWPFGETSLCCTLSINDWWINEEDRDVVPPPKTVGDLNALLLRLTRDGGE